MKNEVLEQVLAIKDLRLDELIWKDQATGHFAVTDGEKIYGVVSESYKPVSHQAVLAKVQEFLPEGKVENVYTDKNLARVVFNIVLPKVYELKGDSPIQTYVNARNSLDGGWSIGLIVSPVRVFCRNSFVLHFSEAFIEISERHLESGVHRFFQKVPVVERVYNALEGQLKVAQALRELPCTTEKGKEFLTKLIEKKIIPQKVGEEATSLFQTPRRKEDEARDFWSVFNATTDVLSRRLEEKGRLATLHQIENVGEVFSQLVEVR